MKSPLALIEITDPATQERVWTVHKTEKTARGLKAHRVVRVRIPTGEELLSLRACLPEGKHVVSLTDLLGALGK